MKKINKLLLPILGVCTIPATLPIITSCSNDSASISYVGGDKSLSKDVTGLTTYSGSETLYFKVSNVKRTTNDKVKFSVLNKDSLTMQITISNDIVWDSYVNGEFHTTISWSSTKVETAKFDLRVQYINEEELSCCVDTKITDFSVGFTTQY